MKTLMFLSFSALAMAEQTVNVMTYNNDFFQRLFLPNGGVAHMIVVLVKSDEPRDAVDLAITYRESGTGALKKASMLCSVTPYKGADEKVTYDAACMFPYDAITGTVEVTAVGRKFNEVAQ